MRRELKTAILLIVLVSLCIVGVVCDGLDHAALANNPFGGTRPDAATGSIVGWILAKQAGFYRELSAAVRAANSDPSATWKLLAICFGYGVFHAAGPGHGKAVITSYLLANGETARRGILLSFLTALIQAGVAVAIVGLGAWLLNATTRGLCGTERVVEIASYLMIVAVGAWMLWVKGASFVRVFRSDRIEMKTGASRFRCSDVSAESDLACQCTHIHGIPKHATHPHGPDCGHSHGPAPEELGGRGGWRRGIVATAAAGMRPCSGAILLLVFALAQGVLWLGVAGTFMMGFGTAFTVATIALTTLTARNLMQRFFTGRIVYASLWMRGFEAGAAALVLLLGAGLLLGYVASERVTCF